MTTIRSQSTGHSPAPAFFDPTLPIDWRTHAWAFLRSHGNTVPPSLACPISYCLMRDPVSVSNGQTYDRASITAWFRSAGSLTENGRFIDPRTHDILDTAALHPNLGVRAQVAAFKEAVLDIDSTAGRYFEGADDVVAIAPRRPRRYMAEPWEERHRPRAPLPRIARGGSPNPSSEDVANNAERVVSEAHAFARRHGGPGADPDVLRAYLDDVLRARNEDAPGFEANTWAAEAEADAELAAYEQALDADEDTVMHDARWSDEDAEVDEAMQAYWQMQSPPHSPAEK